ncbi:MAG: hypothetical protein VB125_04525, partial [Burkholderia sp.]
IGSCRGAQPHDGTCSSAVRPYCLRSKTWGSLRPHVHLCNNAAQLDQRTLFTTQVFVGFHRNTIPLGKCCTSDLRPPWLRISPSPRQPSGRARSSGRRPHTPAAWAARR